MPWHCTVTDEGSPPKAGLTAVRTLAILRLAAVAASAPLCGCAAVISGGFAAGLYRACGAVMSALRAGYILPPQAAKFRSARRAVTFL